MNVDRFLTRLIMIVTLAFLVLYLIVVPVIKLTTVTYIEATIIEKPIDRGNTYIAVEFEDGSREVLQNEDAWLFGKTNSNDYLINLETGHTYRFKVNFVRFPLMSWYRNILDYQQLD